MEDIPDSRVHELLDRWIAGRLTPAEEVEARRVASEIFARPDGIELLREVTAEEGMLGMLLERVHAEDGSIRLSVRTGDDIAPRRPSPRAPRLQEHQPAAWWRSGVAKAAAVLLVVGGAAAFGLQRTGKWAGWGTPEPQMIATRPGQRMTVELPDGSRATLAPNSELRYTIAEARGSRELQLEGEAYFDVRHDEQRPFRIHTQHAVVEDLGTTFVVREYEADSVARVAVRSGAVSLRARAADESSATDLRVGEAANIDSTGAVVRLEGDPESYWSWANGRLAFDGAPLPEVLSQLARWYDVEFQLADSALTEQYFTGAFEAASLSQVLDILGPLVHAHFEQQGRAVIVTPR